MGKQGDILLNIPKNTVSTEPGRISRLFERTRGKKKQKTPEQIGDRESGQDNLSPAVTELP